MKNLSVRNIEVPLMLSENTSFLTKIKCICDYIHFYEIKLILKNRSQHLYYKEFLKSVSTKYHSLEELPNKT